MDCYLFIDFGSTFTKVTLVDAENEEILGTAKSYTTVETDVTKGYEKAFKDLNEKVDFNDVNIVKTTACSSAAGGLKVVAIGLVPELTAEAAKRTALGAGARIIGTYAFKLNDSEVKEIKNSEIDMILLAGGTDGGNSDSIIHNASMISKHEIDVPVVVAGNKSAIDDVKEIFDEGEIEYRVTENVMPTLNEINVEPARETIRNIFMENITKAKGMERVSEFIDGIAMPTPAAVLKAARVLSEGTEDVEGLGDLVVLDIGGATTDVHSIADGLPTKPGVQFRGLEEPFAKRTVEGDLGMRYSALAVKEAAGKRLVREFIDTDKYDVDKEFQMRFDNTSFVPDDKDEKEFDLGMARICAFLSMGRHAGIVEMLYSPMGNVYSQEGKDLTEIKYLIGTGGVIINNEKPRDILESCLFTETEPNSLRPEDPKMMIDKDYILSSMGLLAMFDEDKAVRMLKKYLVEI